MEYLVFIRSEYKVVEVVGEEWDGVPGAYQRIVSSR